MRTEGKYTIELDPSGRVVIRQGEKLFPAIFGSDPEDDKGAGDDSKSGDSGKSDDRDDGKTDGEGGNDKDEWDKDRARNTIQKLRQQEREREAELKAGREALQKLKDLEDKDLSEKQKLEKKLAEADQRVQQFEAERREFRLRSEVEKAARKLGAVDEDAVVALVDRSLLELDTEGRPVNAEKVVKDLLEKRSFLKGSSNQRERVPGGDGTRGDGNNGGTSRDKLVADTRDELARSGRYRI